MAACLLGLLAASVLHHNTARAEKKKIVLRQADTIEGGEDRNGPYRAAIGNVEFLHEGIRLTCDRAFDYELQERIVLRGSVYVTDGTSELFGDNGVYYPERERCEIEGQVRGRMLDGSLVGKAKKGMVEGKDDTIILQDDAIVWRGTQQLSGRKVTLHFSKSKTSGKEEIDRLLAEGKARYGALDTLTLAPPAYNQLSGREMDVRIGEGSRIEDIRVTGEAESLYHVYDEGQQPTGIHYSSGHRIRMYFTEGRLQRIKVTGNAEGAEYPASWRGRGDIDLAGFSWRGEENPFQEQ